MKDAAQQSPAELVKETVGEISKMEYAGDCKAIAAVVIDKDGGLHRFFACRKQSDIVALLGGTVLLQQKLVSDVIPFKKERD
jgi:hypothetical protein